MGGVLIEVVTDEAGELRVRKVPSEAETLTAIKAGIEQAHANLIASEANIEMLLAKIEGLVERMEKVAPKSQASRKSR